MARKKYRPAQHTSNEGVDTVNEESTSGSSLSLNTILLGIILLILVIQTIMMISDNGDGGNTSTTVADNTTIPPAQDLSTLQNNNPVINPQQPQLNPAAAQPTGPTATGTYSENEKDFGSVKSSDKLRHTFTVTNSGTVPLEYGDVTGDAGVTIVSKPTDAIPPGGKGQIVVEWTPQNESGAVEKNVHVNANTQPNHIHLKLKGNVTN